jgi:cysteinyl-tRNA synthetase
MDILLELRSNFRKNKDFESADLIRERLEDLCIVFKDSAEGTTWEMTDKNTSLMSVSKNSKKS